DGLQRGLHAVLRDRHRLRRAWPRLVGRPLLEEVPAAGRQPYGHPGQPDLQGGGCMNPRIAIVGMACRYPDANSPEQLWENVLAARRASRRLPDVRMTQADYYAPDPDAPDRFYSPKAAVLRDYEFDRVTHKIAGSTFRSTDMTHWLALQVAAEALADAGFPRAEGLP